MCIFLRVNDRQAVRGQLLLSAFYNMSNNKIHLYKISLCLMVVYGALLGIASFIEKYNGTEAARELYYHPFVGLLWVLIALAWIISAVQNKLPIRHRSGLYIALSLYFYHNWLSDKSLHRSRGQFTYSGGRTVKYYLYIAE